MKKLSVIIVISFLSFFSVVCNSLNDSDSANVTIKTGINSGTDKTVSEGAPSSLTSLLLTITGPGMDAITLDYSETIPAEIIVEVPSGSNRLFELLAYTPSATLRGMATRSITAGTRVDVPISMGLYETKIVIPDYNNSRIIQINDANTWSSGGIGWLEKDGTSYSGVTIYPYDIDFDNQGRIYIANNATNNNILILNSFETDTTFNLLIQDIYEPGEGGCTALAIDRVNSYIYTTDGNGLYRWNIDGTNYTSLDITSSADVNYQISSIRGIDVDENGILSIAGTDSTAVAPVETIFRYDPVNQLVTSVYQTALGQAWDVIVKSNYLYAADYNNTKIIRLDLDLPFGSQTHLELTSDSQENSFFGPHRFVAILNDKIYLTDDDQFMSAKIVSFDDFDDDIWETYGQHGNTAAGEGYFRFWCAC